MSIYSVSIAKLTRPIISGVSERERLFRLLDEGIKRPVTWIAAPAGSGKTTLVASWLDSRNLSCLWYQVDEGDADLATFFYYMGLAAKKAALRYKKPLPLLTPEYLQGVPTFTRRYFEELYRRLSVGAGLKPASTLKKHVIVLDNYQDAPGAAFQELMANAMDVIPDGVRIIVLSRADTPPQLARLRASNKIDMIGWDDIKFTLEESGNLLEVLGSKALSEKEQEQLYKKADGWAAGLVLMLEGSRRGVLQYAPKGHEQIFNYFAGVIFDRTDETTRNVLLKTAFLNKIELSTAERLTGEESAGRILKKLSRDHYFTYRHENGYQYHPLFREFLIDRVQSTYTVDILSVLRQDAAMVLSEAGLFEDAASLFRDAKDWKGLARLIVNHAEPLIKQGRNSTVREWIEATPREILEEFPWLLYWLGMCKMPYDPAESRMLFEKAFKTFKIKKDKTGLFLAWSNIIDTFIYEWGNFAPVDNWLAVIEELIKEYPGFPSLAVEARVSAGIFNAMTWRKPSHPDLPIWVDRVMKTVMNSPDNHIRMILGYNLLYYHLWYDDRSKARIVLDVLKPLSKEGGSDPLVGEMWHVMEAMHAWLNNDHDACIAAISKGKLLAARTGVHLVDELLISIGVLICIGDGKYDEADLFLQEIKAMRITRLIDRISLHYLCSALSWGRRDLQDAVRRGEYAAELAKGTGYWLVEGAMNIALVTILLDTGQKEKAAAYLDRALQIGKGIKLVEFCGKLQLSRLLLESGSEWEGLASLREAMALGAEQGYLNFVGWSAEAMSGLCAKALDHGIQVEYVRMLIKKRMLLPPANVGNTSQLEWPYPIKIYTLGRFEILVDDKPIEFTGKVQKKPLEMLKAIIAFRGRDVEKEQLIDLLWPDTEGDAAHSTFRSTLHRLRQLLGNEGVLTVKDGKLTLDPRYCRVDAWAFHQIVSAVESLPDNFKEKIHHLITQGMEIYKGEFLAGDKSMAKIISMRERLNGGFVSLVERFGRIYVDAEEWEKGVDIYKKGIEINDLQEDFYRGLMLCYGKLGRRADVQATYNRCGRLLASLLASEPSKETKTVYKKSIQG